MSLAPEIDLLWVSSRFMVVLHSLLRISLWATSPRQSGHTAPASAGAFLPAPARYAHPRRANDRLRSESTRPRVN